VELTTEARSADPSGYHAAITLWAGTRRVVVGNTLYNCLNGIGFPEGVADRPYTAVVENNIIANIDSRHIEIDSLPDLSVIRNNLLYQDGGSASLLLGATAYTVTTANALSYVDGLIEGDPVFVDEGTDELTRNLAIQTTSPAKNAGLAAASLTLDVYAEFLADNSMSIAVDYNGGERPADTDWDIGAYEFGAVVPGAAAPVNTVAPDVTGTEEVYYELTCDRGTWTGVPVPSYAYQWIRCDAAGANPVDISGATGSTHTLVEADEGATIRCRVTGTNSEGTDSETTTQTGVIAAATGAIPDPPTFSVARHITPNSP